MAFLLAERRQNPDAIADTLEDVVYPVVGAGLVGLATDKFVVPMAGRFAPSIVNGSGRTAGLVQAGLTYGVAEFGGRFVRRFNAVMGRRLEQGGKILAGVRALGAIAPNVFTGFGSIAIGGVKPAAPAAPAAPTVPTLPAAGGAPGLIPTQSAMNPELYTGL